MFSILLLIDNNLQVKANYKIKSEFYPAFNYEPLYSTWEGGYPQKKNPKPLLYWSPKSEIFPALFMPGPKIWQPTYNCCCWHSCPKHKFWRPFVHGLINNDEKVASSKQHYPIQDYGRVQNPYHIQDQSGQNRYSVYMYDENSWKTIPFGPTHTYIVHIRE